MAVKYATSAGAGSADGSSAANAWSWATMLTTAAAGDHIYFKGTHTITGSNSTFTNSGTAAAGPITLEGYTTTIGDWFQGFNSDDSLVDTNMPVVTCGSSTRLNLTSNTYVNVSGIKFTGSSTSSLYDMAANSYALGCVAKNTHTGASVETIHHAGTCAVILCDLEMTNGASGSSVLVISGGDTLTTFCRIYNAGGGGGASRHGVTCTSRVSMSFNVIHGVSGYGILLNAANATIATLVHNTIDGGGGHTGQGTIGIGIGNNSAYTNGPRIIGNMITNFDDGIHCAYTTNELPYYAIKNAFYNNDRNYGYGTTTASTIWGPTAFGDIALAADPYSDRANANYSIGSALSLAAGAGLRPYIDVGALQRAVVAGGIVPIPRFIRG